MPVPAQNQYLSWLSDQQVAEIIDSITRERLAPFRNASESDRKALALYEVNSRLSKHVHDVIGGFEVALRNSVSRSIEEHVQRSDWYRMRSFVMTLNVDRRENISDVRKRLKLASHDEGTGRIVAGLSFHFWVSLHENKYRDTLWTPFLHRIWPKGEKIKRVHADLLKIRDLRNRIAHHEPIFRPEWHQRVDVIWTRFDQIAPAKAAWYRARLGPKILSLRGICERQIDAAGQAMRASGAGDDA